MIYQIWRRPAVSLYPMQPSSGSRHESRYDWKGAHREANRGRQNEASSERLLGGGVEIWKRKTTQ